MLSKLHELKEENIRHRLVAEKENIRHAKILAKIKENCTHAGTIKHRSQYYPGGYDYKSRTEE